MHIKVKTESTPRIPEARGVVYGLIGSIFLWLGIALLLKVIHLL